VSLTRKPQKIPKKKKKEKIEKYSRENNMAPDYVTSENFLITIKTLLFDMVLKTSEKKEESRPDIMNVS
jgi:hypothetical protein